MILLERCKILVKTMEKDYAAVYEIDENTDHPHVIQKFFLLLKKCNEERYLTASLLGIIGLIISLIVVSLSLSGTCLISHDGNNNGTERNISLSQPGKSTDEVTETKCKKSAPCEYDWIWSRGKCYYFSKEYNTWHNSQRFCRSHDASLALIDNKEELDFLIQFMGSESHWIGLRHTGDNSTWTRTNGTLYNEELGFQLEASSEKNIQLVYLTKAKDVKIGEETIGFKWICNKT